MADAVAPTAGAYPPPPVQDAPVVDPVTQQGYYPPPPGQGAPPAPAPPPGPVDWETGLLSCCTGPGCCSNFFCSLCCPCCLYGDNYQKMDMGGQCGGCCLFFLLGMLCMDGCVMGNKLRGKLEKEHGVKHSCCGATCAYMLCKPCALCQDAREISRRKGKAQFVAAAPTAAPPAQAMGP